MPRIVLSRALTYLHASVERKGETIAFRRGEIREVGEADYDFLLSRGTFTDPEFELNVVHPRQLRLAAPGTDVPVIRTGGMGDVLMAAIAIREFALVRPDLRVSYATSSAYLPLLRDLPLWGIRPVALSSLRGRYPFVLDLRGYAERDRREQEFRVDVFSSYLVGRPPREYSFPIFRGTDERAAGFELLEAQEGERPWLGIVLAASLGNRTWPMDYVERLAGLAARAGWGVALLHHSRVELPALDALGAVNLTGRTPIQQLIEVIQTLDAVVSPDTGTLHLAEALGVRTVAVMTTVEPDARLRHYRWTRALWAGLPCSPCYHSCCEWADPKPCALAVPPEETWRQVLWMADREPPWPVEAPFEPAVVRWPARAPLKQGARRIPALSEAALAEPVAA